MRNLNRWAIKRKSKQEDMKLGEDGGWRNTFRGVRAEDQEWMWSKYIARIMKFSNNEIIMRICYKVAQILHSKKNDSSGKTIPCQELQWTT